MIHLSRKAFDRLVEEVISSLPERYARWIEEVPVVVEDRPGGKETSDALGLYMGPSLGEGSETGDLRQIFIYRQPLMEACQSREELSTEIRKTLLHELGHYAGMNEEELEDLGYGPLEEGIDWDLDDDDDAS